MTSTIVGREVELAAVERFLDTLADGPAAVVIEGEAGIGKTTVWAESVRIAAARGFSVLDARPVESERALAYVGLTDLLEGVFEETRSVLPEVQERALAGALLRDDSDAVANARTTGTALIGVLAACAAEQRILIAVDDVQWLDPASAEALSFATRRLPADVGLLLARRSEGDDYCLSGSRTLCRRIAARAFVRARCRWRRCITSSRVVSDSRSPARCWYA